mmetsp:Transcript_22391/g.35985  ORF Transcript_22391/g.35985 Transcript_22391/m.35985 type:complete len:267 (+) Transcript_22391:83-883(+)
MYRRRRGRVRRMKISAQITVEVEEDGETCSESGQKTTNKDKLNKLSNIIGGSTPSPEPSTRNSSLETSKCDDDLNNGTEGTVATPQMQHQKPCKDCPFSKDCMVAGEKLKKIMSVPIESPYNSERMAIENTKKNLSQDFPRAATSSDKKPGWTQQQSCQEVKEGNTLKFKCLECETMAETGSKIYTMEHVAKHNSASSCWLVAHGVVYDATPFLTLHPAGDRSILRKGGKISTRDFDFHSSGARRKWGKYKIGHLKGQCSNPCVIS